MSFFFSFQNFSQLLQISEKHLNISLNPASVDARCWQFCLKSHTHAYTLNV